jgi:hypothetical protein
VADQSKRAARQRKEERRYERLRPHIDALYDQLHHHYSQTFFHDPEQVHPLKVGIARDLRACVEVPTPFQSNKINVLITFEHWVHSC